MTTTLEHLDAMRDVFNDLTQDCLLLDLTPCTVRVEIEAGGSFAAWVQFSGTDLRSADTLAASWGFEPGRVIGSGTYIRQGRFDLNGRAVRVDVFTGHPGGPILPAGYAPQAVEVEDGPDPDVCANPDCDHQRAFHHDGGCMGLSCSCAVFEEPQAVEA